MVQLPDQRPARLRKDSTLMVVVVEGSNLPGIRCNPEPDGARHERVHVALCSGSNNRPGLAIVPGRPWLAAEPVRGDAPSARWQFEVTVRLVDGGFDFGGVFVRGDRSDRHVGLAWGDVPGDGTFHLFRAAKLRLVDVDQRVVAEAIQPGQRLVARLGLTDAKGNPRCARVRPPDITWSAEPA